MAGNIFPNHLKDIFAANTRRRGGRVQPFDAEAMSILLEAMQFNAGAAADELNRRSWMHGESTSFRRYILSQTLRRFPGFLVTSDSQPRFPAQM